MTHKRTKPSGAVRQCGVFVDLINDGREDASDQGKSPHYEIWVDAGGKNFRSAVKIRAVDGSEFRAYFDLTFTADSGKLDIPKLATGERALAALITGPGGQEIGYVRDVLFPIDKMAPVPLNGSGVTLGSLLDGQIERAKADADAVVIVFGEHFQDPGTDEIFGFSPEVGVLDIHMMQGKSGSFANCNRVNGDGAFLFVARGSRQMCCLNAFLHRQRILIHGTGAPP